LVERWASNRKVAEPWLTPDAVSRRYVLGKDTSYSCRQAV